MSFPKGCTWLRGSFGVFLLVLKSFPCHLKWKATIIALFRGKTCVEPVTGALCARQQNVLLPQEKAHSLAAFPALQGECPLLCQPGSALLGTHRTQGTLSPAGHTQPWTLQRSREWCLALWPVLHSQWPILSPNACSTVAIGIPPPRLLNSNVWMFHFHRSFSVLVFQWLL